LRKGTVGISVTKTMNDFFIILFKTVIFIISYFTVSKFVFKFFKKRNLSAEFWDVEIIVVSVISAVIFTSIAKQVIKFFI